MGKHIDDTRGLQGVAFFVDQHACIASQSGRVAGHINNPLRSVVVVQGFNQFKGTIAWWVNQPFIKAA